jgi:hypothetical protein
MGKVVVTPWMGSVTEQTTEISCNLAYLDNKTTIAVMRDSSDKISDELIEIKV